MRKYLNKKVEYNGFKFDSIAEYKHYLGLLGRQRIGEIVDLQVHPKFKFVIDGKWMFTYNADFSYIEKNIFVVEDVKSVATEKKTTFRLKKKLIEAQHKIKIDIVLY